ncbi:MAG: hypothetical protein R3B82_07510 [Sandaracinaceae bacterium]
MNTLPSLRGLLVAALSLALFACGSSEDEPPAAETAGGEAVAPAPEVATGPVRSYVADDHTVVMRLDMARVRASSVSSDIASLVRSYPTWQQLLGSSGIDPVRDLDLVLVTAAAAQGSDSGTMLIRHQLTNERVREAVLSMAVDRGAQPEWRQVDGFDVVDWPAQTEVPRVVVITAEHELLVTTAGELDAALAVAHDHRLRRQADEVVEPALHLDDGVIASLRVDELSDRWRARIEHPPERLEAVLREAASEAGAEDGHFAIDADATYADAASAEAARAWFVQQRDFYAGQMLVRAVGLDRPLREAQIVAEGERVSIDAAFSEEEVQRVLGLLAFAQMGGG